MKKIIDVLGDPKKNVELSIYVNEETGQLVNMIDKPALNELAEDELSMIVERSEKEFDEYLSLTELPEKRAWITNNINNYIDIIDDMFKDKFSKFTFILTKPPYSVISDALVQFNGIEGKIDTISGGKVIFDSCYIGNQGNLDEIMKHAELYSALCLKCSELIEIVYVEYKKK